LLGADELKIVPNCGELGEAGGFLVLEVELFLLKLNLVLRDELTGVVDFCHKLLL